MERPAHLVTGPLNPQQNSRRLLALVIVGVIHVGMIYALAAGLAQQIYQKGLEEIKVAVEQPKVEKAPPPPPPDLAKPPPPFVPPPEINIQTQVAPTTNAITTQNKIATPPPPKPVNTEISARGRRTLPPYPPESIRLQEQGTTTLNVTIDESGVPTEVTLAVSSGSSRLDEAAIDWVRNHYKWNPPMVDGKISAARTQIALRWDLKNAR
jgi:periplasmic protein TonB